MVVGARAPGAPPVPTPMVRTHLDKADECSESIEQKDEKLANRNAWPRVRKAADLL